MNIDEKIKQELENNPSELDQIVIDDEGLFRRMSGSFKSGMKYWLIAIYTASVVFGLLCLWAGYRFFISVEMQNQIFWGVCFIASLLVQSSIKQFLMMESNRHSIMREIKRVEIAVARFSAKN